jgi:hypothetical protein
VTLILSSKKFNPIREWPVAITRKTSLNIWMVARNAWPRKRRKTLKDLGGLIKGSVGMKIKKHKHQLIGLERLDGQMWCAICAKWVYRVKRNHKKKAV